jgi:E3 ubiquitin-protein ligase MARCH6
MAKDAFSGQIIVCCVIMAFIAAFLLREWVMANQPHPHAINGVPDAPANNGGLLARPNPGEQVFAQALRDAERAQHRLDAHLAGEDQRRAALEQMDTLIDEALRQEGLGRAHTPQQPGEFQDAPTPSNASMQHTERAGSPALQRVMSPTFERSLSPNGPASEHGELTRPLSPFTGRAEEETLDRSSRAGTPAGHGLLFGSADDSQEYRANPDKHYDIGSRARDSLASSIYSSSDDGDSVGNDMISRKHRIADPDDFGVESASDGEMEPETPATAIVGPAPAAPAGAGGRLHRARGHDHDDPLFGPDPRANVAFGADDPLAIDDDENPDDLFFEADLQGILEAVGIHGPIFVLLQNVALVALLIASLLVVAVWVPLMFGKTVAAVSWITVLCVCPFGLLILRLNASKDQCTEAPVIANQFGTAVHRPCCGLCYQYIWSEATSGTASFAILPE